ncbi:glycoside hydrolase family 28 protein [Opitutus sp. ER46]|uniref:glycoside hydrolase family 28 protein n=1 Tax=Opitutus sp. ER46 TaxID=2161864 RepID=UPI000D326099|nr:glycoside hydrolase family 28 protein [Opitutus sp. ER46]PTX92726.1 glycoside hydrolase [Opitutus sp. ER46]
MLKPTFWWALAFAAGLFSSAVAQPKPTVFNPADFGAVGDGRTNNTAAFAKVMAACASAGGGTVWVTPGKYVTGSIELVDNVTLHLDAGAELLYSGNASDSPVVPSRWECTNVFTYAPLIYANGRHNIAITGRGTINGQGWNWWWRGGRRQPPAGITPIVDQAAAREAWRTAYARIEAGEKLTADDFKVAKEFLRPSLVGIYNCKNVLVEGVTLFKSPMWMLHPVYSDDIVVRGVRFVSADPEGQPTPEGEGGNGDGVDIDSCRNVRISDCFFTTSDDCIVIKSGRDNDGLRTNRPTEYITITNCVMYKGHGAVVIGSETSGGIRNITASNIVSVGTDVGVRIKSMRGRGGVMENFRFDNWVIEDAQKTALEITMRYGKSAEAPVSEKTPLFRNFSYSNMTIVNAKKVATIEGLTERSVQELRFSDINATGTAGFIGDHVDGIKLQNVAVTAAKGSAIAFDSAQGVMLDDVTPLAKDGKSPSVALSNTSDVFVRGSRAPQGTGTFLQVAGQSSAQIMLTANDLGAATTDVALVEGATAAAVTKK